MRANRTEHGVIMRHESKDGGPCTRQASKRRARTGYLSHPTTISRQPLCVAAAPLPGFMLVRDRTIGFLNDCQDS
jgi:hypothetical protein